MSSPFRVTKLIALPLLLLFTICVPTTRAEQVKNLKPQGYVNDFAGVLSAQAKSTLTALCAEVEQKTQAQIAVVTVSSLEGEPVEQFANGLFTAWGVGPKDSKRGVLILVAPGDHKYRFEVGYGLEPILPDGKVGGFGREVVPFLRENNYNGAVLLMTQRVAEVIAADQNVTLNSLSEIQPPPPPQARNSSSSSYQKIFFVLYIAAFLLFPVLGFLLRLLFGIGGPSRAWRGGGSMGGPYYGGGPWGGGGSYGGGGGGGGGFGGFGGGSSGGGGASGSW